MEGGFFVLLRCLVQTPVWKAYKDGLEHGIKCSDNKGSSYLSELKQHPGRGITALSHLCVYRKYHTMVRNIWSKSAGVSLNSSVEFLE